MYLRCTIAFGSPTLDHCLPVLEYRLTSHRSSPAWSKRAGANLTHVAPGDYGLTESFATPVGSQIWGPRGIYKADNIVDASIDGDRITAEFGFLVDEHGFVAIKPEDDAESIGARVSFRHANLVLEASFNQRDGFDCRLASPSDGSAIVSVSTLLAALQLEDSHRARSNADVLREQALFVMEHMGLLLVLPETVLADCRALRFYHAGAWRKDRGSAIQMTPEEVQRERERLERLRSYFGSR
mgnify:CR=1 FL=1